MAKQELINTIFEYLDPYVGVGEALQLAKSYLKAAGLFEHMSEEQLKNVLDNLKAQFEEVA